MAKAKKISIRSTSTRRFSFRMMDALVILLLGAFGSLSLYLYQDIRKDVNVLLQNEQTFKTQVAPSISQELMNLRSSLKEMNARLSAKKSPAPAAVKGKRSAQSEDSSSDALSSGTALAIDTEGYDILKLINDKYITVDGQNQIWDSRAPASVSGDDHGKNLRWVLSQIGLCFSWMLVIGAIVLLILKLIESSVGSGAASKNDGHDQF